MIAIAAAVLALFIFFTHRANIARLTRGEEPRIGQKTPSPSA
jgi:glycerol-3-phosphate acyltransferase PlsY